MKYQLTTFPILLLLLSPLLCHSQKIILDAKITKQDGTTMTGKIDYRNWGTNPKDISFAAEGGNFEKYTLDDLDAFSLMRKDSMEERYVRKELDIKKKLPLSELTWDKVQGLLDNPNYRDTVFLQILQEGKMNLYQLTTEEKITHYFVQTPDGVLEELVEREYFNNSESEEVKYAPKYRSQLMTLLKDCSTISFKDIKDLDFKRSALSKIIRSYNECREDFSYEYRPEKLDVGFRVFGGVALSRIKLEGVSSLGINSEPGSIPASINATPLLGVAVDVTIPRTRGKIYLLQEVGVRTMKGEFLDEETEDAFTGTIFAHRIAEAEISLTYLRFNTLVGYRYWHTENWSLAFHPGVAVGTVLAHKSTYNYRAYIYGNLFTETNSALWDGMVERLDVGLIFGLPVEHKSGLGIEARAEVSRGFSPFVTQRANFSGLHIIASYRF